MYCPKCHSEFRDGISHCANCDVDLVPEAPDQDPYSSPERMAELLTDKDLQAVAVGQFVNLKEYQHGLADERIATLIAPEEGNEGKPGMHARFYLLAAADDIERVRAYYDERFRAGIATEGLMLDAPKAEATPEQLESDILPCPACGEPVPPTAAECPECGLFVGEPEG